MPSHRSLSAGPVSLPAVPATAGRWVKFMLAFGVSAVIGLAPYLGKINVPLFSSMLNLIPLSVQPIAIPLSSALMGVIAVVVQWYGTEQIGKNGLNRMFRRTLIFSAIAFVAIAVVYSLVVVNVKSFTDESSTRKDIGFVVGFYRPMRAPCGSGVGDADCIKKLTLDTAAIESFWGSRNVRFAQLTLVLAYLAFSGSFGAMVGLLTLKKTNPR